MGRVQDPLRSAKLWQQGLTAVAFTARKLRHGLWRRAGHGAGIVDFFLIMGQVPTKTDQFDRFRVPGPTE
ncbi:MAG TPA: hypothetical protein VLS27_02345, partial [Gammaproteobacteria bacterium]|nr:hypothetical protein [Gammaproteobacteria bacterium]